MPLQRETNDNLAFYRDSRWNQIKHGIFTRNGGVSPAPFASLNLGGNVGDEPRCVRRNHERMYASLGVDDAQACTVWQVHGTDVVIANGPVRGRRWLALADGMVTDRPGIALSMRFADCVPLLFFDPAQGVIGMAHAGWRGTVAGVGPKMIETMRTAFGCNPVDIEVLIGPSIGPDRYQVGEEVVQAVYAHFGQLDGLVRRDEADKTAYLDLWAANKLDLERAGVEKIEISGLCTAIHTDEFFSHRAERGRTGRFGAVMCL